MPKPAVVLFDFDGCLVDSSRGILECLQQVLPSYGVNRTVEELRSDIGPPFQVSWANYGMDETTIAECLAAYRALYIPGPMLDVDIYDGIPEVLEQLNHDGYRVGVATSKAESMATRIIEHLGWNSHFEYVTGAELDGRRILKTDVITEALRRFETNDALMLGDRGSDIKGAQANGLEGVGVLWGFGSEAELASASPLALISHPKEIYDLLKG